MKAPSLDKTKLNLPHPSQHQLNHFKAYQKKLNNYLRYLHHLEQDFLTFEEQNDSFDFEDSLDFLILQEEIYITNESLNSLNHIINSK